MAFIYPPKPFGKIAHMGGTSLSKQLAEYEKTGEWLAERKYNGTRNLIYVTDGEVSLARPGVEHKQFSPSRELLKEIKSLNLETGRNYILDGELLDRKTSTPQYKGKIVLYDVLMAGSYLFGSPNLEGRYRILQDICRYPTEREGAVGIALRVTDNIWMAETFYDHFYDRFNDFIGHPEIEGLVLKRKASSLDNFGQKPYDVTWQIRVRKPSKNYSS